MKNNILNARFGDEGKLWHLGAIVIVGVVVWAIIIDIAFTVHRAFTG